MDQPLPGVMVMAWGILSPESSRRAHQSWRAWRHLRRRLARRTGRTRSGEDHRVIEHHILKKHLKKQSSKSSILYFYLVPCSSLLIFALWRPCETQLLIRRRHCKTPGKRARAPRAPRALDDFNGRSHFFLWHPGIT